MKFFKPDEYQPEAWRIFDKLRREILRILPCARVEHIGASSVQGCISKGDLDVFVGVEREDFRKATLSIQELGFKIKTGSLRNADLCPFYTDRFNSDVGLQLVVTGSEYEFFLTFRDLLRTDHEILTAYNELKTQSESLDEVEYRRKKSMFIEDTLNRVPI